MKIYSVVFLLLQSPLGCTQTLQDEGLDTGRILQLDEDKMSEEKKCNFDFLSKFIVVETNEQLLQSPKNLKGVNEFCQIDNTCCL